MVHAVPTTAAAIGRAACALAGSRQDGSPAVQKSLATRPRSAAWSATVPAKGASNWLPGTHTHAAGAQSSSSESLAPRKLQGTRGYAFMDLADLL